MNEKINLIANEKCWIEQIALDQLNRLAILPGVTRVVGLPDLHAGKTPVGAVVETSGILYPHLIGSDIGCGMGLFETHLAVKKYKQDKLVMRLNHIRALADIPTQNPFDEESPIYDLGTIGSGNHFAEFQTVHEVHDADAFAAIGIDQSKMLLLIHSGSRGYGQRILQQFPDTQGYPLAGEAGQRYLRLHDDALLWAARNRKIVAEKLMAWLSLTSEVRPLIDCHHNFLENQGGLLLHRKGAVSAKAGPVVLPGSRGTLTYIVQPATDTTASLASLSHGAGRKWARSLCKARIRDKYDRDSIRQNKYGGRVVCHDTELLYQEAPEAYKNIDHVIAALTGAGLCRVIATLKPRITYKG